MGLLKNFEGGVYFDEQPEIIYEEVSALNAYTFFRNQEMEQYDFEPQKLVQKQILDIKEIPSQQINRMNQELDEIEQELKLLEKEETQNSFQKLTDSQQQLFEVDFLRKQIAQIIDSEGFQQLQKIKEGDCQDIIQKSIRELIYDQEKQLIQGFYHQEQMEKEQLRKYIQLEQQIDQVEKRIGVWNPMNKFMNLFEILTQLTYKVDNLDSKTIDMIGQKAKEFNKELELVVQRLYNMKEVDYDKNKIDFLYQLIDKSQELDYQVNLIIERLEALERIHKETPNIETQFQNIQKNETDIGEYLNAEKQQIQKSKETLIEFAKDIQEQFQKLKSK